MISNRISDERGGSIKTEEQTSVSIGFSLFEQNRGIEGSAIYNRGKMDISHSTFIGNVASRVRIVLSYFFFQILKDVRTINV